MTLLCLQLSFSPMTPRSAHVKLLSLLVVILLSCAGLLVVCVKTGMEAGLTILAFMGAEVGGILSVVEGLWWSCFDGFLVMYVYKMLEFDLDSRYSHSWAPR